MKISLLISAIIVGIDAYFGFDQKEKIKVLTSEWEELKSAAIAKNVSTDPKATFSSQRVRSDSARAAREKAIGEFATELATLAQKMEAAQAEGDFNQSEMQKEVTDFLDKLTNMSPSDLKSLIKALSEDNSIKDETKRELVMMSIMMISSENPEAALALISESSKSLKLGDRNNHMLPMVIGQYAAKDPQAAAAWVVENSDQLGDRASQLILTVAQQGFEPALTMINALDPKEKNQSYHYLAMGVKAGDQDKFLAALDANNLTGVNRKTAIRSLVNSAFIKENFETASTWLESSDLSETDKKHIVENLHFHNVGDSAKEWLDWIGQQENNDNSTTRAASQILFGWTKNNFVAAGEWLQSQEAGPNKNRAIKTYAETLIPYEPAAAADWALTLPDGPERTQLLRNIHSSMKDQDLKAAFAEEHGITIESAE